MRRAAMALAPLCVFGCSAEDDVLLTDDGSGLELLFAPLSADGCQPPVSGAGQFPAGVESMFVRISGYPNGPPFGASIKPENLDKGKVLVGGVPPGDGLSLEIFACEGGAATWTAKVAQFSVIPNAKVSPTLYLTRRDAMSCTGAGSAPGADLATELERPRAFPALGITAEGRALIVGGFDRYAVKADGPEVDATSESAPILEYFPSRGLFYTWPTGLASPRGGAHLVPLEGGARFLVLGGAPKATLETDPPLEIAPDSVPAVEVVDATNRTVSASSLGLGVTPLAGVAWNATGTAIVVTGGRQSSGFPSNRIQHTTGTPQSLVDGTVTIVEDKTLGTPRMGHSATWLPGDRVAIIGGNTNVDAGQFIELLSPSFEATPVATTGLPSDFESFGLHSTALVRSNGDVHVLIVAGGAGLTQAADDAVPEWRAPFQGPARLFAVTLDAAAATATVQSLDAGIATPSRLRRLFSSLTPTQDGRLVFAGGYNQLGTPANPDDACRLDAASSGCYLDDVTILNVQGDPGAITISTDATTVHLGEARFGHGAALLPDGTLLHLGGLNAVSSDSNTLSTAVELYNPPSGDNPCQ
ncbi:MAG: hypothetical protein IV100_20320 [Myxococcales bacterium]|nr:hypothetical protein [Myxococcales bacterium]